MSAPARPDLSAVRDLEQLVRHLGDELAAFRKRALSAEARLRDVMAADGMAENVEAAGRLTALDEENAKLRAQLDTARTRTRGMLARVRFLRQQAQTGGAER
jgi:hypothetical protein